MAKLFNMQPVLINGLPASPGATSVYVNPKQVVSTVIKNYTLPSGVVGTGTEIQLKGYDNTFIKTVVVSNAPSTITTRMNAANTTDVYAIPVTIIPTLGSSYVQQINVDDIFWLQTNDQYTSDSLLQLQNPTRSMIESYRVDETPAAINTLANA